MKRSAEFVLMLLVVAVVTPGLAREAWTLAELKQRAVEDAATPEGKAYLKQFFTNPWSLAFAAAGEQCRAAQLRSQPHEEFVIALRLGDNGYPIDAVVSPEDEGLQCLADRLRATGFIKPPHDNFAIYLTYKNTEPGTEQRDR